MVEGGVFGPSPSWLKEVPEVNKVRSVRRINFRYSKNTYWFRFKTKKRSPGPVEWLLEYKYPLTDNLTLYVPDGKEYRAHQTGIDFPFNTRQVQYRTFAFRINEISKG